MIFFIVLFLMPTHRHSIIILKSTAFLINEIFKLQSCKNIFDAEN
jgi:hypothetical protein